ncbi:hypothetical protein OWR29_17655 [Actinoplanes sp. Pm04-4]|uniref:Leucine rich repeat variant n=1 Tax=Paractinoplanes pyxinae TaxID=2997416 RepID=A0ABT4B2F5_9ACTN|nr:hypothetical protein [Actinoplanes pyxinae]MCY1139830.1 hypothetical protein [Actinoplanes pyxinae]
MSSWDEVDVLRGLAANPAAPEAVRIELPASTSEAALAGPDQSTPDTVGRAELDRLHSFHVRGLMTMPELGAEVSEWVARRGRERIGLAVRHPEPVVRLALLHVFRFPYSAPDDEYLQALTEDDSAEVRNAAARVVADLTERRGRELERDDIRGNGYDIRYMLSLLPLSRRLVDQLIAEDDPRRLAEIVVNPSVPDETAARLIDHADPEVRKRLAERPGLTPEQVARLLDDPDLEVRRAMVTRAPLPVERVVELLDDPELAEAAAANPALPEEHMWRLIRLSRPA